MKASIRKDPYEDQSYKNDNSKNEDCKEVTKNADTRQNKRNQ